MSVNTGIPKVDGMGLVTGKPAFTDDIAPKDALLIKILRCPHAFAEIKKINIDKALALKGIKCILTYENITETNFSRAGQGFPEPSPYDHRVLNKICRYIGEPVAVVAGVHGHQVDEALKLIEVEYDIFKPVTDFETAIASPTIIHKDDGTKSMFEIGHQPDKNIAASYEMSIGDVEETLKSCDVVYSGRYYTQAQAHSMTEPHSSAAYLDKQDRLTIISSTQTPFHVRRIVGKTLDLPLSRVRVVKPRVGGGYGGKQALHGEFFVALVTMKTGLASKLIYSRQDVFEGTYTRHEMRLDVKIGATSEGHIEAIDMTILSNTGAYGEHALTVLMVAGSKTLPLYNKVKAVGFRGNAVYTNLTPAGAFRGYGAVQGNFALESAIDELADLLEMDSVALREKNMMREGETSEIFEIMGEGQAGTAMTIESCKLQTCLDECLKRLNYHDIYPKKRIDEHRVRSVGYAIAMQGSGIPYIDMGSAIIKLNDDGFFNLLVGATDLGTGSDTVLAQIAAETLNISSDKIIVYSSDTDLTPFDTGAYASSTTYVSGHSVRIAAEEMKEKILEAAKVYFESEHVTFDGKHIQSGDEKVSLETFSTQLFYNKNQEQLVSSGSYVGTKSPPPYMVGGAEIEIDERTGVVDLINYVAVVDCGTTINPNLARIQIEGALVQGIGMTLYEEVHLSESGQSHSNNFLRYKVPTRMELKNMDVSFADSHEPSGPYGAKSVGEIGIDTPPAAIANAIKNATGKRLTRLPIRSEDIWKAINS